MKPVVRFVILDVHIGLGHDGLNDVIRYQKKKNPLFARALKTSDELILFLNKSRSKAKLYSEGGNVIGYLALPRGQVITAKKLDEVPRAFGGSLEYGKAVKSALDALEKTEGAKTVRFAEKSNLAAMA